MTRGRALSAWRPNRSNPWSIASWDRRDGVILATKFTGAMGEDPNQQGASRRWIIREVENSLRRLNTDWIDLYQVHRPPTDTDTEETLGALNDLVPDEIVPPGTTINPADNSYDNPALQPAARRR